MGATDRIDDGYSGDALPVEADARRSDVHALRGARALVKLAHDLHQQGEADAARDAAMDALAAWADGQGDVDEEIMVELLEEVGGVQSRAILDVVSAGGVTAFR